MKSNSADSAKEASADVLISASPEESVGHRFKELPKSTVDERPNDRDNNVISPRSIFFFFFFCMVFQLLLSFNVHFDGWVWLKSHFMECEVA